MSSDTEAPKSAFKVGDRVQLTTDLSPWFTGAQATVIEIREDDNGWPVRIKYDTHKPNGGDQTCPVAENEIRLIEQPIPDLVWEKAVLAPDAVVLDKYDPFESVLIQMVSTNRKKRSDYAVDGSPWSNFDDVSTGMGISGFSAVESAEHNIRQKLARLTALRQNGRTQETANEAVDDTYLDLAVYAVIALAIHTHPSGSVDA